MSRYLGRIAVVALSIGFVSLGLAYALGGRDLAQQLRGAASFGRSCNDGTAVAGSSERHLAWAGDNIDIALPAIVRFRAGEGSDIVLHGAPDTIAHVALHGGHLVLDCNWGASTRDLEITLPGQTIRRLGISGSGRVEMDKLNQRELTVDIKGSGDLRARGAVDRLTVKVAGSGDARLAELAARQLTVHIAGSGNVEAAPQDEANIKIAGSGNVRLLTRPARLQTHVAGSGRISQPQEAAEGKK